MLVKLINQAKKKGSDIKYRKHIQKLPCAICGDFAEYLNGEGRSHAAHVRRSSESGVGIKPAYAYIPLCYNCHILSQHRFGEAACYRRQGQMLPPAIAKEKFDQLRIKYLKEWISCQT